MTDTKSDIVALFTSFAVMLFTAIVAYAAHFQTTSVWIIVTGIGCLAARGAYKVLF